MSRFCRLQYVPCRVLSITARVMSRLVDYSTCRVAFSRLQCVSCRVLSIAVCVMSRFVDYSMCHVAFCRLQHVSCRVLSIALRVMSRFVNYSTCCVAFCRLQHMSCRVLSITVRVISRFVDYSMCHVSFSRLQYVGSDHPLTPKSVLTFLGGGSEPPQERSDFPRGGVRPPQEHSDFSGGGRVVLNVRPPLGATCAWSGRAGHARGLTANLAQVPAHDVLRSRPRAGSRSSLSMSGCRPRWQSARLDDRSR